MTNLEMMMEHYSEALEELMDAQKYVKMMAHASNPEDRTMYRTLAKQELEHEAMICKSVGNVINDRSEPMLQDVWHHLKKHLMDWRGDIERRIMESEK